MAGIKDVAKRAGVGVGTVSRMINDSGYVALETRRKIETAMKELDYTPNELARNLYHKKTGIVAILVPTIATPFFSEFIKHAESSLHKAGIKTMLCNAAVESDEEQEYLDMLNRHIVDGIITGVHSLEIEEYKKLDKPIVALDRYLGEKIPLVAVDHKSGGRMAAETLVESGCTSVLHFRGAVEVDSPYHDRHYEFEKVMQEHGVKTYPVELEWNRFDSEYYAGVVQKVYQKEIDFDGIFGVDLVAIECMNEAIRRHKKIPRDVKVVAYDGTYITKIVEPGVTSIVQPIHQLAEESVKLIVEMINGKRYRNKRVLLETTLRKGRTTV